MTTGPSIDGVLVQWGERVFYPRNRIVRPHPTPRLHVMLRRKAAVIRNRIEAIVVRRAPQVMVKIASGGRGMRAIAAHFQYISRDGGLVMEDDRGVHSRGKDALRDLADQWRYGGSLIDEVSQRQEALYVTLSMPHGTDLRLLVKAARSFAHAEFADHRYVMVPHRDQAHPHVHLTVRAESKSGERLQTWTERHRWREVFARHLRALGVDAEATTQPLRGASRRSTPIWRAHAIQQGTGREAKPAKKSGQSYYSNRMAAMKGWLNVMQALAASPNPEDRRLSQEITVFLRKTPFLQEIMGPWPKQAAERTQERAEPTRTYDWTRTRPDREMTR